jgi:hypothetical protein
MNKTLYFFFLGLTTILFACEKDEDNNEPENKTIGPRIKTEISYSPGMASADTQQYKYDNEGRVTHIVFSSRYYETYDYSGFQVTRKAYTNDVLKGTGTYTLNANGYAIEASYDFEPSEHTKKFEYDATGKLIQETRKGTDWADTTFYEYESGNLVKNTSHNYYSSDTSDYIIDYTYYSGHTSTIENANYGKTFYADLNTNLPKTISSEYENGTFYYEFDTEERVIQKTLIDKNDTVYTIKYIYVE